MSAFGVWVRAERKRQGISSEDLSERVGISVRTIYDHERGRTSPTLLTAGWIAEGLNRSYHFGTGLPSSASTWKDFVESERLALNLSQTDFCEEHGINRNTFNGWIYRDADPKIETVEAVCHALGRSYVIGPRPKSDLAGLAARELVDKVEGLQEAERYYRSVIAELQKEIRDLRTRTNPESAAAE